MYQVIKTGKIENRLIKWCKDHEIVLKDGKEIVAEFCNECKIAKKIKL